MGEGGGVNMENVDTNKLKQQLMNRIDIDDLKEVEKVERYCDLVEIIQECRATVKKEGPSIVIENGSQRFVKSHPSMNDISKFNAQLISLEKTFNFVNDVVTTPSTSSVGDQQPTYTKDDLT